MFRRRRAARQFRRMFIPDVPPLLQQANQLMTIGNYAEAANAFEQLAKRSEGRFPERTPYLYLEAGQASVLSGQIETGVAHIRRGLTILASQGRFRRMRIFGRRAVDELNERGFTNEASEIVELLKGNQPQPHMESARQQPAPEILPSRRPILPTHCPSCGGPLRPDEVEWMDELTAECVFCGSPVRGDYKR